MRRQGFRFYWRFVTRHWLGDLPAIILGLPAQRMSPTEVRHGIRIADPEASTRAQFSSLVGRALSLIASSDPVRLGRVRAHIHTVVNIPGIGGSAYGPAQRVCTVSLRSFSAGRDAFGDPALLAATLVHDATFGHLIRQGVFRTSRNHDRFDRLCCREAQRFMHRLGMTTTPWDPENLKPYRLKEALAIGLRGWQEEKAMLERRDKA